MIRGWFDCSALRRPPDLALPGTTFPGGPLAEVALACANGELDLSVDQVIDELVDVFHRMNAATMR